MQDSELTKELIHFLRNAITPMGGLASLIKRKAWELHVEGKDDERIHLIINCLDQIMQGADRFELEILDMEIKGVNGFLENRKAMYMKDKSEA